MGSHLGRWDGHRIIDHKGNAKAREEDAGAWAMWSG